jgi:hypothetical protein
MGIVVRETVTKVLPKKEDSHETQIAYVGCRMSTRERFSFPRQFSGLRRT